MLTEPVPELLARDRLDGRRGDLRRAHVPALLPHDGRRPRADGLGLRPDRLRREDRRPLHARRRDRRRGPSAACAASSPASPTRRSTPRGAARSTSRPTTCRSSAPFPGRASTTRSATPGTASARPGSPGRRSPRASPASTTSGRACRSSTARSRASRPSRSGGSAAERSAPRSSPARRRRRTDGRPRCPRALGAFVPRALGLRLGQR